MASLTISPEMLRAIAPSQELAGVSTATSPKNLVPGETLRALVTGYTPDQKAHLQIKGSTVIAESPFPLQAGDKLTVRVEQVHPTLVLQVLNPVDEESIITNNFTKLFRSNPNALKDLFISLRDFLSKENINELSTLISKKDIQALPQLMERIIVSRSSLNDPLYLKEGLTALGLTLESDLKKLLTDPSFRTEGKYPPNLKTALLNLAAELQYIGINNDPSAQGGQQRLEGLANFVDHALRVIESLQIVNVLAQEQDQFFAFQIPFQCSDGIRMQDLFIETEKEKGAQGRESRYRVVLFVDMDALGDLAIEASLRGGNLQCTIKCPTPAAADFMGRSLDELQEKLSGLGYVAPQVQCILDRDLPSWKQDFLLNHRLYSQNTIDLCI